MTITDPMEILLAHDRWATRQMIDACAALNEEQFHQRFEMGRGSLHDNLVHVFAAMRSWTQLLAGEPLTPRLDDGRRLTPTELTTLLDECCDAFAAEARRRPVGETVTRDRDGKTYTFARGVVVTHVATHGMHHRAQCLNMLRHLGVTSLPKSSVVEWSLAAAPAV